MSKRYWIACDGNAVSLTGESPISKTGLRAHANRAPGSRSDAKHTEEEPAMVAIGKVVVMCMHCKRIRIDSPMQDCWCLIQEWVDEPPDTVSHGLCPECLNKHYPAR